MPERTTIRAALGAALLFVAIGSSACDVGGTTPAPSATPRAAVASAAPIGFPACDAYGLPIVVGRLRGPDLVETSGIAVSRKNPGVLWAHNDSGDGPYLYAVTADGAYLGRLVLVGVKAVDWEDLALGPCGDDECLYVADTGDNRGRRTDCAVYRVPEPAVGNAAFGEIGSTDWERFPYRFPDGPHNAEALAVHPDGSVYLITKRAGAAGFYVFPELTRDAPVVLDRVGDLQIGDGGPWSRATAADIHRGGSRLLVRTYMTAWEWRVPSGMPFASVVDLDGDPVPTGTDRQGEAIAYDPADGSILHTSEGDRPPLWRVVCDR
jgi:hypothetical protein